MLVDWDHARPPRLIEVYRLLRFMGLRARWLRLDRTHHGWHMIIDAGPLPKGAILCVQAILGDDPRRGAFNFRRARQGVYLNQLYEVKL